MYFSNIKWFRASKRPKNFRKSRDQVNCRHTCHWSSRFSFRRPILPFCVDRYGPASLCWSTSRLHWRTAKIHHFESLTYRISRYSQSREQKQRKWDDLFEKKKIKAGLTEFPLRPSNKLPWPHRNMLWVNPVSPSLLGMRIILSEWKRRRTLEWSMAWSR